ncbi:energy-coupling factor transporter transmembrane component T family protein [Aestuariimicrobium soli]|uniref:energy-coupling factor transporter transmembrane component T family protein n=1 Tax=Aestuariimicrobium soli TaxID=2035834 RepID=UPI003EBB4934
MLSLYSPGTSVVHRWPAGVKLAMVMVVGTLSFFVHDWRWLAGFVAVVLAGYAVARVPWSRAWRLLRGVLVMLVLVVVAQGFLGDWGTAAEVGLRLLGVVALANLVTLTTTQTAIIDAVVWVARPLRRLGVDPDQLGLLIALVLRFIPVIADEAARVREAQAARGVPPRGMRAAFGWISPLVIRTLRMADGLGEALEARISSTRISSAEGTADASR